MSSEEASAVVQERVAAWTGGKCEMERSKEVWDRKSTGCGDPDVSDLEAKNVGITLRVSGKYSRTKSGAFSETGTPEGRIDCGEDWES